MQSYVSEQSGASMMPGVGRRVRGWLGMSLIWGGTWMLSGAILSIASMPGIIRELGQYPRLASSLLLRMAGMQGVSFMLVGLGAGVVFSGMLSVLERRKSVRQLSGWRLAAWGAVAGFLPTFLMQRFTSSIDGVRLYLLLHQSLGVTPLVGAAVGALTAMVFLRLARRGEAMPIPSE